MCVCVGGWGGGGGGVVSLCTILTSGVPIQIDLLSHIRNSPQL